MQQHLGPVPRQPAQRRPQPQAGGERPGVRRPTPVGETPHRPYGGRHHDPLLPVGVEQAPAVPGAHQPAVQGAEPGDVEEQAGAHRRVQPVGERHRGVLRPALLGDERVPLGQREPLGLLLQVVEEVQEPFFPAHA